MSTYLDRVQASADERRAVDAKYCADVKAAKIKGKHSIREIAKAAGYSSPSTIQNILSKQK